MITHDAASIDARRLRPYDTGMPSLRAHMAAVDFDNDGVPRSPKEMYLTAINELDETWNLLREDPFSRDMTTVFSWLQITLHQRLPELRGSQPSQEALAVFCYFCLMMAQLPRYWWFGSWAERFLRQTYALLDEEHKTWIVEPSPIVPGNFILLGISSTPVSKEISNRPG